MARSRRNNSIQNTFKDYFVPIIGWVLIIILIYSFFSNTEPQAIGSENENRTPTEIVFWDIDTEAFIMYDWDKKEKINETNSIYQGETLIVKTGSVRLNPPDGNKINLNKIAELKLEDNGSYSLYSSDAWFTLASDSSISMRYANIEAPAESVLSLTQNEAGSTIYVLSGSAKVSNLAWVSTLLIKGQKVSVSRLNAANEEIDLAWGKANIDSYFKWSDWFIANEGHITLNKEDVSTTADRSETAGSETTGSGVTANAGPWATGLYLSFDSLKDEMSVSTSELNISGKILSEDVSSITINNAQANIDSEKKFTLDKIQLWSSINDIVVKVYDTNKNIIEKKVYSVYSDADWVSTASATTSTTNTTWNTTTYIADATKFGFTAPSSTGKFSTVWDVTIRWITSADGITRVTVNGTPLSSFNGSTWRYHAFERFKTLQDGTNQYKIDYYGSDGKIVYTDYYTIVKKITETPASETATSDTSAETTVSDTSEESTEDDIPEEALFTE